MPKKYSSLNRENAECCESGQDSLVFEIVMLIVPSVSVGPRTETDAREAPRG